MYKSIWIEIKYNNYKIRSISRDMYLQKIIESTIKAFHEKLFCMGKFFINFEFLFFY